MGPKEFIHFGSPHHSHSPAVVTQKSCYVMFWGACISLPNRRQHEVIHKSVWEQIHPW